jgi:hypothetical protein
MRTSNVVQFSVALVFSSLTVLSAAASNKCMGADGKVEYRDQPCGNASPASASKEKTDAVAKPSAAPADKFSALFNDYEPRLCERERLASEVDRAARSGKSQAADFKVKEDRLRDLNEDLIQFQAKLAKLTVGKAFESEEMVNVRQFQSKVRKCGKLPA